ncbi:MAG: hypothetical protein WA979_07410 [Pacificimonas sp.]
MPMVKHGILIQRARVNVMSARGGQSVIALPLRLYPGGDLRRGQIVAIETLALEIRVARDRKVDDL